MAVQNNNHKDRIYESIVNDIRNIYGDDLSETETHQAARNFMEFVRALIKMER